MWSVIMSNLPLGFQQLRIYIDTQHIADSDCSVTDATVDAVGEQAL